MAIVRGNRLSKATRALPQAHEWEMVSGFMLRVAGRAGGRAELLAPVAEALRPYGLDDDTLLEISGEVERVGEELRGCCPEGRLECVNVRVHLSAGLLRKSSAGPHRGWDYFVIKNMASSESDNLDMFEDPRCYIDVYVFEG